MKSLFVFAGLCDISENVLLLISLEGPSDALSLWATVFALGKFTGLVLGVAGLVILRAARRHPLSHE